MFQLKYDRTPDVSHVPGAILTDLHCPLSLPHPGASAKPEDGSNHPKKLQIMEFTLNYIVRLYIYIYTYIHIQILQISS